MKPLTGRTGVRIKAALSIIHKAGHDVAGVERRAENAMRQGAGQAAAYGRAMQDVFRNAPGLKATVERVDRLLSKSDDASIAQYGRAVDAYIATRDEGPLDALAPMMKADMQALAVRAGEVSVEDASAGRVDWVALGVPGFAEGSQGTPATASPGTVQGEPTPQWFAFGATPGTTPAASQAGSTRTQPNSAWTNQVGTTASPTGVRTGKAAERWERAGVVTIGNANPTAEVR